MRCLPPDWAAAGGDDYGHHQRPQATAAQQIEERGPAAGGVEHERDVLRIGSQFDHRVQALGDGLVAHVERETLGAAEWEDFRPKSKPGLVPLPTLLFVRAVSGPRLVIRFLAGSNLRPARL